MTPTPEQIAALPEEVRRVGEMRMAGKSAIVIARTLKIGGTRAYGLARAAELLLGVEFPGRQRCAGNWIHAESFRTAIEIAKRGGTPDEWRLRWGGTARQGKDALYLARLACGIEHKRVGAAAREEAAFKHVAALRDPKRCGRCHLIGHDRETCDLPGSATSYANRQNPNHSWMT